MATILRVKRKKNFEPLDALLLSCKRQKLDSEDKEESGPQTSIIKFAGTVEKQDEFCLMDHIIRTFTKDDIKKSYKQHIVDIKNKVREKKKEDSKESRYKIMNQMRSLNTMLLDDLDENVINVIDVEDTKVTMDDKNDAGYVYDLYYAQAKEALQLEDLVSVSPIEEDLVFEDYYKENDKDDGESEDSNSESNWRNDYPDSDHSDNQSKNSDESVGERQIRNAIKNLELENNLSSDGEDFAYGLDQNDVEMYGYKYAEYKARMKREVGEGDFKNSDDSEVTDQNESNDDEGDYDYNNDYYDAED